MSQYLLIVATLHEFDLITDEQLDAAIADWNREIEKIEIRKNEFRNKWVAEREAKPWWRRIGPTSEYQWLADYYRQEKETDA